MPKNFCCWLPGLPIVKKLPKGVSPALVELVRLTAEERTKALAAGSIHLHHNPNVGWHECNATILPPEAPLPFEVKVGGASWMADHRVEFSYGIEGNSKAPRRILRLWKNNGGVNVSREKAVNLGRALVDGSKLPRVKAFDGSWSPLEQHRIILGVALAECIRRYDAMEPYAIPEA